jgi:hypothetical protein
MEEMGLHDEQGQEITLGIEEYLKLKRNDHCDGFSDLKNKVFHIWFDKDKVEERTLLQMLTHEKAHFTRPIHRDIAKDEIKAEIASIDAIFAYDLTKMLLEE